VAELTLHFLAEADFVSSVGIRVGCGGWIGGLSGVPFDVLA
jgi:hypothetical protein